MSFLSFFLAFGLAFAKDEGFRIRRVTPQGDAKQVSQVRVEFAAPAVRFGAMNAEAPVTGECLKNGEGRWIDTVNWVFDFKDQLPGGLKCRLVARDGLKSVAGKALEGKKEFFFTTGGPAAEKVFPETWNELDEDQIFIVVLDAPVEPSSVEKNVFLSVEGLGDKLPVEVLRGSLEDKVLRAFRESSSWQAKELLKVKNGRLEKLKPIVVIKSPRRFPFGAAVILHWGPGVMSTSGVASRDPQLFEYKVRADFTASFSCSREQEGGPCIPLLPMSLNFTTAVRNKDMRAAYVEDGKGKRYPASMQDRIDDNFSSWFEFRGPFDPKTDYKVVLPSNLRDETGRPLANMKNFPLMTKTGENPPLLKFAADFGVIEGDPGAALPVTVRDIEVKAPMSFQQKVFPLAGRVQRMDPKSFAAMIRVLKAVRSEPYGEKSQLSAEETARRVTLQKPNGEKEFEVIGIPLNSTGFYFVEVESPRLGAALLEKKTPFYVRSTALVTKMAVHLKFTEKEAFVWVTRLKDAQPVAAAEIELFDCRGGSLGTAKTAADGTARVKPVKALRDSKACDTGEFYAVAAKDGDFTFTSSDWDKGIEIWRYRVNTDDREPIRAHTILDRNLLRPGETMSMKHVLRRGTKEGFGLFAGALPKSYVLEHESGLQKFEVPLKWNAAMGTAESQWKIPEGAKLGRWHISLNFADGLRQTVSFRIENYKVPLLKGHLKLPDADLVSPSKVPAQLGVEYLAGGGAGALDVKTRWSVSEGSFSPKDDELSDFRFLNGGMKAGLSKAPSEEDSEAPLEETQKGSSSLKLAADGTGAFEISGLKPNTKVRDLRVEAEYRDPNGEIQTTSARARLWPTDRLVGIKALGWGTTREKVAFDAAVLDLKEKPVEGAAVDVEIFQSESVSHRKRLVGGFYAYESSTEVKSLGRLCQGKTDKHGRLRCQGSVKGVGTIYAVARVKDGQGRLSEANASQWVVDNEERLWFGSGDADRIDLIPSKKRFEPGDNAEFLVQAPFRQAKILFTIEREGVIEHRIVDWDAAKPAVSLPVKASWAPNVFVSALVVRGRVPDTKPTALIDLGKPAFKMGLTEIEVGWKKHELKVKVATDAKTYPVRGKAKAHVKVTDADGKAVSGEVSLAAVDEGLLLLLPNSTWQLLERMMDPRPLLVRTSSMQNQIVGKRHFGLKAVAAGGDGGRANLRELFDTLLLWKGTVKLNAKGEADVEIPINDSLTSFRVVAIALNGRDQFGTGWTSFRTTQELMMFSGAPTLARSGDRLVYTATVRNTGTDAKTLEIALDTEPMQPTTPKKLTLASGQSTEVSWPLVVPAGGDKLVTVISAKQGNRELDRMKSVTRVAAVWKSTVRQSTLVSLAQPVKMPMAPIPDAVAGSSSIAVEPVAGLASGRGGLIKFWDNYVYTCLEQRVSRAVTLNDLKAWQKIEAELETFMDSNGRLKFFPGPGNGSAMLNAYVLRIVKEAGWKFSAEREGKLLDAVVAAAEKRDSGDDFRFADGPARQVTYLETLSRYGRFKPTLMAGLNVTPNLWPTSTVEEWFELIRREKQVKNQAALATEAENILRSRMVFTGGKFAFSDAKDDNFWWLYRNSETPTARLILATAGEAAWNSDLPRVLRGFIEKQTDGAWSLTTSNAWGRLALDRYKEKFEKDPVTGKAVARLQAATKTWEWSKGPRGDLSFAGPTEKTDLELRQEGGGKPYAFVRALAAVPVTKPVSSGFFVEKSVEILQKAGDSKAPGWNRGDVLKVTLKVRATTDGGWVVVDEPLPPGGVVLGTGFGNDSDLLQSGSNPSTLWPEFEERSSGGLKIYYRWVPKGDHVIEYRVRLNQAGVFHLPATRLEAMYDPDIFAEAPNAAMEIKE